MFLSLLSLNSGELSPYLHRRTDFAKHPSGVAEMTNFLPLPYGGIRKRPGTQYLATLAAETHIETFIFDGTTRYVLAFTTTDLKIFGTDGTLKDTITANFSDPFALRMEHINDVLFIADPGNHPRRLTRNNDTDWTLENIPWEFPPVLDQNLDEDHTLAIVPDPTPAAWATSTAYVVGDIVENEGLYWYCHTNHTSGASTEPEADVDPATASSWPTAWRPHYIAVGGSLTVTASKNTFVADHVGGQWCQQYDRPAGFFDTSVYLVNTAQESTPIPVLGKIAITTTDNWFGTVIVQKSTDGKTWTDVRSWWSSLDRNVDTELTIETFAFVRIKWDPAGTTTSPFGRATISVVDEDIPGIFEIDTLNSATSVDATAKSVVFPSTNHRWKQAAFDAHQGFPAVLSLHEQRLVFGGTALRPVSMWFSKSDDFLDFETGTLETSGMYVTLATTSQDPIRWMVSQRRLMLGTSTAEWVIGSESTDTPLTPENFNARAYTAYGSANIPAYPYNDGVFFIQRQGRRVREIGYDITREAYDAADLTRLAEHITTGGLTDITFQVGREPVMWAIRADGTLLSFHYNRAEQIAAWSKHITQGGSFVSCAIARNETDDDDLFLVTLRGGTHYLELLAPGQQAIQEADNTEAAVHLDFSATGTTDSGGILTGLDHLNGQAVSYYADGIPGSGTVSSNQIDTDRATVTATAGLPVTSTITTLPLDVPTETGNSHARQKTPPRVFADFYKSRAGTWTFEGEDSEIAFDLTSDPGDATPHLFTGWKETNLIPAHTREMQLTFTHALPYPCTLRAIQIEMDVTEN